MIVTVDGPGGVGKSTVSRTVAAVLGVPHLDTGSTYRVATLAVLTEGVEVDDEPAILAVLADHTIGYEGEVTLDGVPVGAETRSAPVTDNVSAVSAHPGVRERIVSIQRAWVAEHGGDAVVEGRDIGTVVFPSAPVKVYLTARPEVRAARRAGDDEADGATVAEIAEALSVRDRADASRSTSPMRPAADAVTIDTSDRTIDEVVAAVLALVDGATDHDGDPPDRHIPA